MCFVLPELQGSGVGRALLDRTRPARRRRHGPGDRHRQRPADQQCAVCLARDRAPRPAAQPHRPAEPARRHSGRLPSGIRAVPFERIATDGHERLVEHRRRTSTRRRSACATRSTIATCAPRVAAAGSTRVPMATPLGYGYAGEAGRVGPVASRDPRPARPDPRSPHAGGRPPRGVRDVAARDADRAVDRCARRPASGSSRSRSCCAGTARWSTCRATCRSRRDCSRPLPVRPLRTGPSSGWPVARRSRLPTRGAGGSLGPDVVPAAVPADGVEPKPAVATTDRHSLPPAESPVTIAPAPSAARSLRRRILERGRDQAIPDRAVLVLHDVTKQYPNGKIALRDVDLVIPEGDFVFLVGPSGAGQVDADQAADPRRGRQPRRGRARRPGPRAPAAPPGAADAPQDRDHLPGLQAAADQDGLGERRVRARGHRLPAALRSGPPSTASWRSSGSPRRRSRCRPSSRAASSSARRSPAPSSTTRG